MWRAYKESMKNITVTRNEYPATCSDKHNNPIVAANDWITTVNSHEFLASIGQRTGESNVWVRYFEKFAGRLAVPAHYSFDSEAEALAFILPVNA
jgi:hypothetical protein